MLKIAFPILLKIALFFPKIVIFFPKIKQFFPNFISTNFPKRSEKALSGLLYKSCQPCPWGQNGLTLGVISSYRLTMGKTQKNLLLQNHKAQSFHILCVAMYKGPLYKSCRSCPWDPYSSRPGASWEKHKKF